jgi:pimeloyl-ACP methyl ester carboxylesterase
MSPPLTSMRPPSPLLLALEGRAFFEWSAFAAARAWLLRNVPRGDAHPVMVLPGLIASDRSTGPLRRFLGDCGYHVYPWEQGFNRGPVADTEQRLLERVQQISARHDGRKVSLVGWSLGGAMARALAVGLPEHVRSVITLGSPLGGDPKATNAWRVFEMVSGLKVDDPGLHQRLIAHPEAPFTSIFSKTDGVVHWRLSMAPETPCSENIVVQSSHLGLGANPAVLWAIADRLAQCEGEWQPMDRNGWHSVFFRELRNHNRLADLISG